MTRRRQLGRVVRWTLAALGFVALDYVRIEGVDAPAVQWVRRPVGP